MREIEKEHGKEKQKPNFVRGRKSRIKKEPGEKYELEKMGFVGETYN